MPKKTEELVLLDQNNQPQTNPQNIVNDKKYELSNPCIYYTALLEKALFFIPFGFAYFQINLYLDIFCNKNNHNCSNPLKKFSMSSMNSINCVANLLSNIIYPFLARFNPKFVFNASKVIYALSFILFSFGSIRVMIFARFLLGLFGELCHVIAHWMLYQIALPRDKEIAISSILCMQAVAGSTASYFSSFDNGGHWTWRVVNSTPAVLVVVLILVDLTILRKVNGFDYLYRSIKEEEMVDQLATYYQRSTAKVIIEDLKRAKERKNQLEDSANRVPQPRSDGSHPIEGALTRENKNPRKQILEKMKVSSAELINCSIMGLLMAFTFNDVMLTGAVYFGSHKLGNRQDVKLSKQAMSYGTSAYLITSFLVPVLKLNKKRKLLMLSSQITCSACIFITAAAYFTKKLWIARMTIIPVSILNGFIFNAIYLYTVDICHPGLISIPFMFLRLATAIVMYAYPYFFDYENSTKRQLFWRLLVMGCVSLVSVGVSSWWMIETDGLSKAEIRVRLRGRWGKRVVEMGDLDVVLKDKGDGDGGSFVEDSRTVLK